MNMLRATTIALGGLIAVSVLPAEAMPIANPQVVTGSTSPELQPIQYGYGYGARGYGYGYRRPFGYRRYGYGFRRPYGYGYRRHFGYGGYGYRRPYRYGY